MEGSQTVSSLWSRGGFDKIGSVGWLDSAECRRDVRRIQVGIRGGKSNHKLILPCLKVGANTASQNFPQNVDLPPIHPKKKKKPFVTPMKVQRKRPPPSAGTFAKPPANGLLVKKLIPVAHTVMRANGIVEKGVARLVQELPIKTCRYCTEVHVGPVGHNLGTCRGPKASARSSRHDWLKGSIEDILVPVEAYHLEDRLGAPVTHDQRFNVERILAVEELCIQAGYENPRYPTKRYTEPVVPKHRKRMEDATWTGEIYDPSYNIKESNTEKSAHPLDETGWTEVTFPEIRSKAKEQREKFIIEDDEEDMQSQVIDEDKVPGPQPPELGAELLEIGDEDDLRTAAEKTLVAWEVLRLGARRLMSKYRVVACGYCPEVHVGPRGHRARNCGAFKHQWRDGKHGWQDAALDELIPSQYVWHVRDRNGPPLENSLKRFYGKAPAIIELCVQAGAEIPDNHKPLMRLDIAIPTMEEVELVV
ncbi:hypothetical protein R1flu_027944 [Riccia fluitans]|uniref:APO domain-containing protein n=1 Tax=Riccia fluitans TaxID=41844 RepID=A0ABD1XN80_9MARC